MKGIPPDRGAEPLDDPEAETLFAPDLGKAAGILIGVSGGPDSMALLGLLAAWPGRPSLAAATVNHHLRAEAADEAAMVAAFCNGLGIAHTTLHWEGVKPRTGLQEAAREARYALLVRHAKAIGCSHIVTAHHAGDQAETVLMRLIAGSGITGLAGMRRTTLKGGLAHMRPLLGVAKARLVTTCRARSIPFVDDPLNTAGASGRARMRRLLAELDAQGLTAERLNTLATRSARASAALDDAAKAVLERADVKNTDCRVQVDWRQIAAAPEELRLRALNMLVSLQNTSNAPLRLERLEALLATVDQAAFEGRRIRRSIGNCIVTLQKNGLLSITGATLRKRGMDLDR
jgi:tRNA(Ile)-lysidine synthase